MHYLYEFIFDETTGIYNDKWMKISINDTMYRGKDQFNEMIEG